jgi:hypothetical protein
MSTSKPIRLSPSGPVVGNSDGGNFIPGPGTRLRLVQGHCTVSATTQIPTTPATGAVIGPTLGSAALNQHLDNPQPGCQYRASISCDLANQATTDGVVTLFLDTSVDGVAWTEAASNSHNVAGGALVSGRNGSRRAKLDLILTQGADLGVTSSPASPALYVRGRILGTNDIAAYCLLVSDATDAAGVGTIVLELEETL